MDLIYDRGLGEFRDDWATGTFVWLLAQNAYVPDRAHEFIDDVTNEVSVGSYTREAVTGAARVVDTTLHLIRYSCDNPNFGTLEDTQDARWLILARDVTTDADSPLIVAYDLGGIGVNLGDYDPFEVSLHPGGLHINRQVPA